MIKPEWKPKDTLDQLSFKGMAWVILNAPVLTISAILLAGAIGALVAWLQAK